MRHYLLWPLFSRRIDKEAEVFVLDVLFPLFHYETTPTVNAVRFLLYPYMERGVGGQERGRGVGERRGKGGRRRSVICSPEVYLVLFLYLFYF